ncbi:alpha/beta hydrolase [Ruegeria jejuensis]|uniref:alpha/beta hydrolase n=1 Tax=Ruegeria jejuensis TaxID=3233338 RepID=UPI00355BB32A
MAVLRALLLLVLFAACATVIAAYLVSEKPATQRAHTPAAVAQEQVAFAPMPSAAESGTIEPGGFAHVRRGGLSYANPAEFTYEVPQDVIDASQRHSASGRVWYSFHPDATGPAPVILLLHGSKRNGLSMIDMWRETAKAQGLVLIAPDARGDSWGADDLSPALLDQILDTAAQDQQIDRDRIYLFGHSSGAIYAAHLINRTQGPWKAAVLHGGFGTADHYRPANEAKPVRLYLGEEDALFSVDDAVETGKALARAGHSVTLQRIPGHTHWFYVIGPSVARDSWQWLRSLPPHG